jgi:hypothetical protein
MNAAASERSPRAKAHAHAALQAAVLAKRVHLGVNIGIANRPGSPVFIRRETAVPLFLSLFGVIGATLLGGPMLGLIGLALGVGAWFLFVLPRLRDRVYERSLAFALGGVAEFETMWGAGALSLMTPDGSVAERRSPAGDWVAFAEALADRPAQDKASAPDA